MKTSGAPVSLWHFVKGPLLCRIRQLMKLEADDSIAEILNLLLGLVQHIKGVALKKVSEAAHCVGSVLKGRPGPSLSISAPVRATASEQELLANQGGTGRVWHKTWVYFLANQGRTGIILCLKASTFGQTFGQPGRHRQNLVHGGSHFWPNVGQPGQRGQI